MCDIENYKNAVIGLAERNNPKIFLNKGADHAVVVLSTIFKFSNEEILLFSGNKKGEVTDNDDYNNSVIEYLNCGKKLKVILENRGIEGKEDYKVYATIKEFAKSDNKNVCIKYADNEFI
jgi:hypothetical protein